MGILSQYEPKRAMEIFEEISAIPHGSGNRQPICEYLNKFASDRGLEHYQDEGDNVVIIKEATPGYENADTIIIQGHSDMVCVKTDESDFDFMKDGLKLGVDGDWVFAHDTTLGGDDGVAVAIMLAILDSDDICHPRLEMVITSDEEIGLVGAGYLDFSRLKGRKLINIDSGNENAITVSCAGGTVTTSHAPVSREKTEGEEWEISVTGLIGGHSGAEIDKGRANANILMGRVLAEVSKKAPFKIVSMKGGSGNNVIANSAFVKVIVSPENSAKLCAVVEETGKILKKEYLTPDPYLEVAAVKTGEGLVNALTDKDTEKVIQVLRLFPQGIQAMSMDIPGLVQTSINMGTFDVKDDEMVIVTAIRSSVATQKEELLDKMERILALAGGEVNIDSNFGAWEYKKDSKFRQDCVDIYKDIFGREPGITATHGGLECGIFCGNAPDLDCISIGVNLEHAHEVKERMSISSFQRIWKYVCEILKRSK